MTAQEAYDLHRSRAFRDTDAVEGVFWEDPIEALAAFYEHVRARTPDDALSDLTSAQGRKAADARWARLPAHRRQLHRRRAALALVAAGVVEAA